MTTSTDVSTLIRNYFEVTVYFGWPVEDISPT